MGIKIYAYIGIALLVAAAMWWFDNNGYSRALAQQALAEKEQLKADSEAVSKIDKQEKVREKVIYKWKTKIKTVTDKNCYRLDEPLPAAHIDKLRNSFNAVTRPKTN